MPKPARGPAVEGTTGATKPTDADRKELVERAIERRDKLAESEVEMARLFLAHGKTEIARRRLREVVDTCQGAAAVDEARRLLGGL